MRCQNDSVRSSNSDYIRICDAVASNPHLLVLDTYYYTTDTLMQMSSDFDILQWLSMAFVFVVLLLSFHFNFKQALLGFAPILLSWLFVLGVMNLFGVQFNLISIIISTFIFGIGVDYSIFVMNGLIQGNLQYHKTAVLLSAIILIITVQYVAGSASGNPKRGLLHTCRSAFCGHTLLYPATSCFQMA